MKKDNVWVAFKRTLANIAHGVTGRPFTIVDILAKVRLKATHTLSFFIVF